MTALGTAINLLGKQVDILGNELGVSSSSMAAFDSAATYAEASANSENTAVQVAAWAIGAAAVVLIGEEALAAGAATLVGVEALEGAAALVDACIASDVPALFGLTSGQSIVASAASTFTGFVVGDTVQDIAASGIEAISKIFESPTTTVSLNSTNSVSGSAGPAAAFGNNASVTVNNNTGVSVIGSGNKVHLSYGGNADVVGGGNTITGTGSNSVLISGTSGSADSVSLTGSGNSLNIDSNTQTNFSGSSATLNVQSGSTVGAAGGSNQINGSASDTLYVSGTGSSTADTLNTNSATINTSESSYLSITGGGNTVNDTGKSVFNAAGTGTNADTFNLNLSNVVGLGGTVYLGSGANANVTGGGSNIVGSGDNQVGLTFSKNSADAVTINGSGLYSNVTVGANTQANVNATSAGVSLSSGDSVGVYGGGNIISTSANNLLVIGGTNGTQDTINAGGAQSGGTTANGQPTGIQQNAESQAEVWGNNDDDFGNAKSSITFNGTGDRALVTGGDVGVSGPTSSVQVVGNDNTAELYAGSTINDDGTHNIVAADRSTINIQQTGSTTVVNGSYDNIHDTTGVTVNVTGQHDTNYGTSSDSMVVYGNDTGDTSSGTSFTDDGGSAPSGSDDGYGYGYGYDFIKGKLPQSTTNIASIAGFDNSLSAVATATSNDERTKALQSATDSASGASTLGDTLEGLRWNTSVVTWSFGSTAFNAQEQAAIEGAFAAWSAVSGVKFEQVAEGKSADIALNFNNLDTASSGVIGFTSYKSADGSFEAGTTIDLESPTDTALTNGQNGQLTYSGTGVTLSQVALHEIGHALGLNDTSDVNSAMYYGSSSSNQQLDATDIANIQLLYGSPTAPLNAISTASPSSTSGKDASPATSAANVRGSANTQAAALTTPSDASVNQLIQSIAAFKGSSSAASGPSLLSPDEHPLHLAARYKLSA